MDVGRTLFDRFWMKVVAFQDTLQTLVVTSLLWRALYLMIWDRQCFRRQSLCPTFVEQLTHEMFVETFDREVVPPFVPVMAGGVPL